jgi:hypothetical protein
MTAKKIIPGYTPVAQADIDLAAVNIRALKNRKTGKSASRKDGKFLANRMWALELQSSGLATGIGSLMPPLTTDDLEKITKIKKHYELKTVAPRRSRLAADARSQVAQKHVRARIAVLYHQHASMKAVSKKPARIATSVKAILKWVVESLQDHKSPLFAFLEEHAPDALTDHMGHYRDPVRRRRWWADQFKSNRR